MIKYHRMKILDFINQLTDVLPFNQDESLSFQENVKVTQKEFLEKFNFVDESDLKLFLPPIFPKNGRQLTKKMLIHKFNQIHLKLNKAIERYYEGKPASAYREIKQLLANVSYVRDLSDSYQGFLQIKDFREFDELNWFRLRKISKDETESPKSSHLFHPPFEKRGKAGNYRFSISGFPCLYLGDSINLCWEEINKSKKDIFASRFNFKCSQDFLRPLNITIPEPFTEEIYYLENQVHDDAFSFLITFPVIQLCLFKVKDESIKDNFKPEYIIPQLLMQFMREEGFFNSVVYSTTKTIDNKSSKLNHNLVLPARRIGNKGFCPELMNNIKVSIPLPISCFDTDSFNTTESELLTKEAILLVATKQ